LRIRDVYDYHGKLARKIAKESKKDERYPFND